MSWERRIARATDHVRMHLDGELSIAELAHVAHISPYHFARLFKATTGETVVHYVQRARLERAAFLMKANTDRPLGDIAFEVGFCALSDLSRVFRRHYGIPPSGWDRRSRLVDALPGFTDGLEEARKTCPLLSPRRVVHPACRVAYVRLATPFLDAALLQQGYDELTAWFAAQGIDWRAQKLLGLSWDHPEATPIDQVRFDLGLTLPDKLHARGELGEVAFDAIRAVDVRVSGTLGHIALAWAHLYEVWLPRSGEEPADLPGIKRFRRRPDELGWRQFDLDCSIALR